MTVWLLLAGIAPAIGGIRNNTDAINIALGVLINVAAWYIIFLIVFKIYDKVKGKKNEE